MRKYRVKKKNFEVKKYDGEENEIWDGEIVYEDDNVELTAYFKKRENGNGYKVREEGLKGKIESNVEEAWQYVDLDDIIYGMQITLGNVRVCGCGNVEIGDVKKCPECKN